MDSCPSEPELQEMEHIRMKPTAALSSRMTGKHCVHLPRTGQVNTLGWSLLPIITGFTKVLINYTVNWYTIEYTKMCSLRNGA